MNLFDYFKNTGGKVAMTFVALTILAAPAVAGEMTATWKDGLSLSDGEGTTLKFGGRIYSDWGVFFEDDDYLTSAPDGAIEDGTEFRTTRLYTSGTIGGVVVYKSEIDFSQDKNELKDMYLGLNRIPGTKVGVRVGRFKQPFSLEELTSSKYGTFMERSVTSSFAPGYGSGLMVNGGIADTRGTFAASIYREASAHGKVQADGDYSFAGRVTFVPWLDPDNDAFLHIGAAATLRNDGDSVEFGLEPEAHLQPDYVNADEVGLELMVQSWTQFGAEAALVYGPFSAQGEFVMVNTSAAEGAEDGSFSSFYAQGSYFVTGESRAYKKSTGTFDRVKPSNPMTADGGSGALELAARFSSIDLSDGDSMGGTLDAVTLGANWHLNNSSRVMLNYVRSDGEVEGGSTGITQAIQARFQVDF